MIKKIAVYIIFISFISNCKSNTKNDLQHLSGYWEIESVTLKNGNKKTFSISEMIDYIKVNDSLNGIRKKMKPLFNGNYETSNATERFKLKIENDSVNIYYETKYDRWKETILKISKTKLKIVNQNNTTYIYKRYIPISIN